MRNTATCYKAKKATQFLLDGSGYLNAPQASGTELPDGVHVYCLTSLETAVKAGIPIAEVNALRPLLYSHGERLIGGQHLSDLIPVLHKRKISTSSWP